MNGNVRRISNAEKYIYFSEVFVEDIFVELICDVLSK